MLKCDHHRFVGGQLGPRVIVDFTANRIVTSLWELNPIPDRQFTILCVTSSFRRGLNEIFALLRSYATQIGSKLPTFRNNLSVPFSSVKQYKKNGLDCLTFGDGTVRLSGNVGSYLHCVRSQKSEDISVTILTQLYRCSNKHN